ncbi:unnamed protein product [Psylliodes chrysocephalus]|uniref:Peptidase S1 domain-containing protein n=1 Tax=Psylliodes chrysocephalus TaxID=3402493 RepID=A0A9P0D4W0_9CUCU|nr:unnamed protein product [Psylliodes chrysocephala]
MISLINIVCIFSVFSLALGRHTLKIVEGEDADIKDYPYMAAYTGNKGGRLICGTAIINENTLLTAAHCMFFEKPSEATITYGATIFYEGTQTNISQTFIHENFTGKSPFTNDIAVLKIDPPLVFSETVQPIKLPQSNTPNPEGKIAKFAGWGISSFEIFHITTKLQKVNLTITDNETCEGIFKGTDHPVDSEKQICAQADTSDGKMRGVCNGDSGGPLVIDGVTYGITSTGPGGCGNSTYPTIYTRVANYIDWISDKL